MRGLCHVVASRADLLASAHTLFAYKTLARGSLTTPADDAEAAERQVWEHPWLM